MAARPLCSATPSATWPSWAPAARRPAGGSPWSVRVRRSGLRARRAQLGQVALGVAEALTAGGHGGRESWPESAPSWRPTTVGRQLGADSADRFSPAMAARPLCSATPSATWPSWAPAARRPACYRTDHGDPVAGAAGRSTRPGSCPGGPRRRSAGSAAAGRGACSGCSTSRGSSRSRGGTVCTGCGSACVRPTRSSCIPGRDHRSGAGPARLAPRARRARAGGVVGRAGHRLPRPAARRAARRAPAGPADRARRGGRRRDVRRLHRRADARAPGAGPDTGRVVDDGPPRRTCRCRPWARCGDLADVIARVGIGRVIVCFSSDCRDEDLVRVLRACRPLLADICVAPRLYELGMAVPRGCLDEIWGVPLIPLRRAAAGRPGSRATDLDCRGHLVLLCLGRAPLARVIRSVPARARVARPVPPGRVTGGDGVVSRS